MPATDNQRTTDETDESVFWERNFADQMRRLRELKDMTQTDLARVVVALSRGSMRFHQQTVQRIEAGERPVRLNEAQIIARALDTDVEAMTSRTANQYELRFAVNRTRTGAERLAEWVLEGFQGWLDDLNELANELANRVEAPRPNDSAMQAREPVSQWGLAWMAHTLDAAHTLNDAWTTLMALSRAHPREYEDGWEHLLGREAGILGAFREWQERYMLGDSKVVADEFLNADVSELYDMFPEQEES